MLGGRHISAGGRSAELAYAGTKLLLEVHGNICPTLLPRLAPVLTRVVPSPLPPPVLLWTVRRGVVGCAGVKVDADTATTPRLGSRRRLRPDAKVLKARVSAGRQREQRTTMSDGSYDAPPADAKTVSRVKNADHERSTRQRRSTHPPQFTLTLTLDYMHTHTHASPTTSFRIPPRARRAGRRHRPAKGAKSCSGGRASPRDGRDKEWKDVTQTRAGGHTSGKR